jgi:hypothetical protein
MLVLMGDALAARGVSVLDGVWPLKNKEILEGLSRGLFKRRKELKSMLF